MLRPAAVDELKVGNQEFEGNLNMKISSCVSLYLLLAAACVVQATYRHYSRWHCSCNGRSQYCLQDAWGLHCINCQGNTTGRHCERCKDGFYQQVAGLGCSACGCDPVGAINSTCDSRGRCYCKEAVSGEKCTRCSDGPIGPNGCRQRRQLRGDSGSSALPCFCFGHSSRCSAQSGYSIHPISSTFTDGPDGWKATVDNDMGPNDALFRWSPRHQDLEVISTNSLPVYLNAPAPYLGNQLLSYGQNFSFSLRLDHSVRQPSQSDVVLEGSGLRVAASLGALRSAAPCRQKVNYSFRLDEQPSSGWRPQLSTFQFQMLLQNLTTLKIRATFGQGRGYVDNVQMVSAQRGEGRVAHWVWTCRCPLGYEGDLCNSCSAGFKRTNPAEGAFSSCEPCGCRGGSCDPHTGDCYAADETPGEQTCPRGFYRNRWHPDTCLKCPCPDGVSCTVKDGSVQPHCDQCPPGSTGPRCDVCQEGFYGDPVGAVSGVQRACRPCECNGHISISAPGSCDGRTGECLKCVNNTRGRSCQACLPDFYHSRASDACRSCDCDLQGSQSTQCDDLGRCRCKPGFQGNKCQTSNCPACFSSIKMKMKEYATKLEEILFLDGGGDQQSRAEMEAGLRNIKHLLDSLQRDTEELTGLERELQEHLSSTNTTQMANRQHVHSIAMRENNIQRQRQSYTRNMEKVLNLLEEIKGKLDQAKDDLGSADIPAGDASQGSQFPALLQAAAGLADMHQREADVVQQRSGDALDTSLKTLALSKTLTANENKVKELIGHLKNTYEQTAAQVKGLENRAERLSSEAADENMVANNMHKEITQLEQEIPSALKDGVHSMASVLSDLTGAANKGQEDFDVFQRGVEQNKVAAENLLNEGRTSGKVEKLLNRTDVARDETNDALRRINGSTDELRDALNTLKGFTQQINNYRTEANAAIQRLHGINSTIQQAVRSNEETQSVLRDMSEDYNQSLGTINVLENLVNSIEGTFGSLPPQNVIVSESSQLKGDSEDLKVKLERVDGDLNIELDAVRRLEDESVQGSAGAAGALQQARQSRAAVDETLREINNLFSQLNQTDAVDLKRLQQVEASVDGAQRNVEQHLKPWLSDVEAQEAAQKRRLYGINTDIDNILADIENLKVILQSVPNGCFNTLPIENP
ncbi:laminin subunit gamma-2 isoform X2 [Takifugu rubripes]|uniref:laminin subunit gamma-2 isoform X2 n=1 Tax=Takifugu rubripes TaxID=31033 RepID=UPI00114535C3|nr:laminin subunit gamma-2-like isoform X2 [Takifugu rubripes]